MDETRHPDGPRVGHETTDVNVWAVSKFGIALVVVDRAAVSKSRRMPAARAKPGTNAEGHCLKRKLLDTKMFKTTN